MSQRELPVRTRDFAEAKRNVDEHGYALIADALTAHQVEAMAGRLREQAAGEADCEGRALPVDGDDTSQTAVMSLLNKGRNLATPARP